MEDITLNVRNLDQVVLAEDKQIFTEDELQWVLSKVSFDHSVIDFKWEFKFRPATFPPTLDQATNAVTHSAVEGWLIWAEFERPDIRPPHAVGKGRGRDEIIIKGMRLSGIVKTCWVLVEMLVKHELMEGFRFMGIQIFNPHATVFELMMPALRTNALEQARTTRTGRQSPEQKPADLSWLTSGEREALAALAAKKDMTEQGLMRMALRTFQAIDTGAAKFEMVQQPGEIMVGCGGED